MLSSFNGGQLARAVAEEEEGGAEGAEASGRGRIGSKPVSKYTSMEQQVSESVMVNQ